MHLTGWCPASACLWELWMLKECYNYLIHFKYNCFIILGTGFKMAFKLGCLVAIVLISSFILQAEAGRSNGRGCRKNSQCNSGNCCGVWPLKKCRECCQDSDCPAGQNCK